MADICKECGLRLDEFGNCPFCSMDLGSDTGSTKTAEKKKSGSKKKKEDKAAADLPRTKPIAPETSGPEPETGSDKEDGLEVELDDGPELSPEDIEIDYSKLDASTLFDDEFEEKTSRMLPQVGKPSQVVKKAKPKAVPLDPSLGKRTVFGVKDKKGGDVKDTVEVSYRTKGNVISKKGQSLVLLVALIIIFIIIIGLRMFGFLDF
jgi:hypothetical protein